MKSTWFNDPFRKDFAGYLTSASKGRVMSWDVFRDFLEMAYTAAAQAIHVMQTGKQNEPLEKRYLDVAKKYPDTVNEFPKALGVLTLALEERRYDFLGTFAGEAGLLDGQWKGQFFTPPELCQSIVQMLLGDAKPDPNHRITICEPACGAGAMAIAAGVHLQERGFFPWNYWIDCQDVDYRMFQACFIQMNLCGFPAVVRCGNTLTLEQREVQQTLVAAMHPLRESQRTTREPMQVPDYVVREKKPSKTKTKQKVNPFL